LPRGGGILGETKGESVMIPSSIQRSGRGGRASLPVGLVIAGGIALIILAFFAWVLLSMGTPPQTVPVQGDISIKI
jgi:hypothetical protein